MIQVNNCQEVSSVIQAKRTKVCNKLVFCVVVVIHCVENGQLLERTRRQKENILLNPENV